ncbi:MAG: outer membrane protein assembly factor BamB [Variovorax sp.]|nr:outer membrane protein assembly factor BamB [Variovorax sp.]
MNSKRFVSPASVLRAGTAIVLIAALAACSTGADKPKPAELPANVPLLGVRQAWSLKIPQVRFPLQAQVSGDVLTVAASDGTVVAIDARTGQESGRASPGAPIEAGVGSDGSLSAVVTTSNELVALEGGKVLWKQQLTAETYTAPLVAGRRVFVQTADRTLSAYDGQSGRRLWSQTRTPDALVLRKGGVLLAVGDTLVSGIGGRLVGTNPANGASRWEAPIAAPRGTNDVERLVDLTGGASRVGDTVCARAYYASVGCVDTARGMLMWSKPAVSAEGVSGDDRFVFGTEADGKVIAWRRADGERAWVSEQLRYRTLSAPLAVGRSLIIGDNTGLVHFLSREDGTPLNRMATDGSAIAAAPVLAGNTVVVVTRNGGVYGFRPE